MVYLPNQHTILNSQQIHNTMISFQTVEDRIDVINQLTAYRNSLIEPLNKVISEWVGKKVVKSDGDLIGKFREALVNALLEPQYVPFNGRYREPYTRIIQARGSGAGTIDITVSICHKAGDETCAYKYAHIYVAVYEDQVLTAPHALLTDPLPLYDAKEQYDLLQSIEALDLERRRIDLQIHPSIK